MLVITAQPGPPDEPLILPRGRLSASASPVTVADTTTTTIYYHGKYFPVFSGGKWVNGISPTPYLSLPLDPTNTHQGYHSLGSVMDFWIENSTGTPRLITSGMPWTATNGPRDATGQIARLNDLTVNYADMTYCKWDASASSITVPSAQALWVGTGYFWGAGQLRDARDNRHLWSAYNRVARPLLWLTPTASWTYNVVAWRQWAANTAARVQFVRGLDEDAVDVFGNVASYCTTGTAVNTYNMVALDNATGGGGAIYSLNWVSNISNRKNAAINITGACGSGLHAMLASEYMSSASLIATFQGSGQSSGLAGWCMA